MNRLQDRTAIIWGGAGSIGTATARRFVAEGATVYLAGRTEGALREAAAATAAAGYGAVDVLDEDAVTVADGRASLTSSQVSERIQILAADRLKGLSPRARQFTETASVMGNSFRFEDVAEMLSQSPGALLGVLDEAVSAHLLAATPDGLAFQHEFVRQAVAQLLPKPIEQALHWQFGHMLLERGGSAIPAARHLLDGARPGDSVALAGLDRAEQPACLYVFWPAKLRGGQKRGFHGSSRRLGDQARENLV